VKAYPHMCRCGHVEIGHADSECELCPLCAVIAQRDALADELVALREFAGGLCVIQKVIDVMGPMSLWSKKSFEIEIERRLAAKIGAKHD
jgi:hypothetical protein